MIALAGAGVAAIALLGLVLLNSDDDDTTATSGGTDAEEVAADPGGQENSQNGQTPSSSTPTQDSDPEAGSGGSAMDDGSMDDGSTMEDGSAMDDGSMEDGSAMEDGSMEDGSTATSTTAPGSTTTTAAPVDEAADEAARVQEFRELLADQGFSGDLLDDDAIVEFGTSFCLFVIAAQDADAYVELRDEAIAGSASELGAEELAVAVDLAVEVFCPFDAARLGIGQA
jgi:hypothetical protein